MVSKDTNVYLEYLSIGRQKRVGFYDLMRCAFNKSSHIFIIVLMFKDTSPIKMTDSFHANLFPSRLSIKISKFITHVMIR